MMFGGNGVNRNKILNKKVLNAMKPILEKWCGRMLSDDLQVYGIRRYLRGAWLSLHVDKPETHIVSAILQV